MEESNKYNKKADKEKLEAIKELLRPRKCRSFKNGEEISQEVIFHVSDNSELRYVISCLLRVSIAALELEGTSSSPRTPYLSNELAIVTILELINDILPDEQLESYDAIEKLLLERNF
ncbi:hypothetical protein [Aestuariibaculum sediminum]|uniref:Uncharacterized protein n=1 Tax=Aestuariibaculum sediminum TaxID=2770637 RepID=A0A8J6Q3A8_9FLAO|nr:hypothetical protein [Aestuariibaculum sediminum]MBD0833344.1 hypothetical protein [Aestuariibaculum sediminum]